MIARFRLAMPPHKFEGPTSNNTMSLVNIVDPLEGRKVKGIP